MSGDSAHSDSEIEVISRSESMEDMLDAMMEEDIKALNLDSLKKNLAKSTEEVIKSRDAEVERLLDAKLEEGIKALNLNSLKKGKSSEDVTMRLYARIERLESELSKTKLKHEEETRKSEKAVSELAAQCQKTKEFEEKLQESEKLIDELKKKCATMETPKMEYELRGVAAITGKWKYITSISFGDYEDALVRRKFAGATLNYKLEDEEFSTWMERNGEKYEEKTVILDEETTISEGRTTKTILVGERLQTTEKLSNCQDYRKECRIERYVTYGVLRVSIRDARDRTLALFTRA